MARENRGVMKNNLFLYLTEFFAGMSVMAVELERAGCWLRISVHHRSYGLLL